MRYDCNGDYISKGRLLKLSKNGRNYVKKALGINFYKVKKLYEFYGIDAKRKWANQYVKFVPGNHAITKIEHINKLVDVYDIEVQEFHNFFANEICVYHEENTMKICFSRASRAISFNFPRN